MGSGLLTNSRYESGVGSLPNRYPNAVRVAGKATPAKRRAAERSGRMAEADVAAVWQKQGFDILAQRLRTPSGEIDLIVADTATLVFVEVKSRPGQAQAAYSVTPRQQSRLLAAADCALAMHEDWRRENTRFDVALVCNGAVCHIQDAIRYS